MKQKYKTFLSQAKKSPEYWEELFTLELTENILKIMTKKNINQKKLSRLLSTSEAYISKMLNGNQNLSIKSISKLAFALNSAPHIHIAAQDMVVEWNERNSYETRTEVLLQSKSAKAFTYRYEFTGKDVGITRPSELQETINDTSRYEVEFQRAYC